MRILNIVQTLDPRGGGPIEWVRQFTVTANRLGHDVEVATLDAPSAICLKGLPFTSYGLGSILRGFYSPRLVSWLRDRRTHYDCVVAHGLWRYVSIGTRHALHGTSTPYFIYTHGMLGPWFKEQQPLKHILKSLYWPLADYRALRDAQTVLFTCEEERRMGSSSFKTYIAKEAVATLGQTTPPSERHSLEADFLNRFPALKNKRVLLFLGRIVPIKGCDDLIYAFAKVADMDPDLMLVIAGPDQAGWRSTLEAQAERLGVGTRVYWTDMLDANMRWGALYNAEAFVLPSHHENFSFTTVEALACGTPVLISRQVGIWRDIVEAGAGLVADDDRESMTRILQDWLTMSASERTLMQERSIRCFRNRFELKNAVNNLIQTLQDASVRFEDAYVDAA